jgi:plasmid maintenance system killer protein
VPKILPLKPKISKILEKHSLGVKFRKQLSILAHNPKHPGLHVELLEPKQYGIYSFRVNRKYRALFIFREDLGAIEILNVTLHYR